MKTLLTLFALIQFSLCFADDAVIPNKSPIETVTAISSKIFSPGHNLTPTAYVLDDHQWTAGFYAVGYGVTDRFTVATSPFIIAFYNTAILDLKYAFLKSEPDFLTGEFIYFRSMGFGHLGPHDQYDQNSMFDRLTYGHHFSPTYTLHLSTGFQYFWNSQTPYSLDPNPGQNKYVLSLSILSEIHFDKSFGMNVELGVLGLNYSTTREPGDGTGPVHHESFFPYYRAKPYAHLALSFFYQHDNCYLQVGVSRSSSTLVSVTDPNDTLPDVLYHPEMQLQFTF